MKKLTSSLLLCAAITFALTSCNWFTSNKRANNSLVGKWKIDSVTSKKHYEKKDIAALVNYFILTDSIKPTLELKLDSLASINYTDTIQNIKYYTDENEKFIFIKTDSTYRKFFIRGAVNNTELLSADTDSFAIHLSKM